MAAMTSRSSDPVPPGLYVPTADERIVMHVDWGGYQSLLALRGGEDGRRPKLAYLDGAVELMSPSYGHERMSRRIGQAITLYCLELGIPINGYGSWTLNDETRAAGAEPDECFVFADEPITRHRPDLVIEVSWTRGGIDKLEIYRRLGVAEVWFWDDDKITVYSLGPDGYSRRERSTWVPELDLELVCELAQLRSVNEMLASLRSAVAR